MAMILGRNLVDSIFLVMKRKGAVRNTGAILSQNFGGFPSCPHFLNAKMRAASDI